MEPHLKFGILLIIFLSIAGCVTPPTRIPIEPPKVPAGPGTTNETPFFAYATRSTLSCENLRALDAPRLFPLPLAGYLVGPTAARLYPKLKLGILRPFTSDGCSFAPNGNIFGDQPTAWIDCCIRHDAKYWLGGTEEERRIADGQLEKCIGERSYGDVAKLYARVVAQSGTPESSKTYRWGYGWNYRRRYAEINENEEAQVLAMYGVDKHNVAQKVFAATNELVKYCDSFDSALRTPTTEEKNVYLELNRRLQKNDIVEWSRWRRTVIGRRRLEVKLQTCATPIIFTFTLGKPEVMSIEGSCTNLRRDLLPAK
jgi:hypothetical protein